MAGLYGVFGGNSGNSAAASSFIPELEPPYRSYATDDIALYGSASAPYSLSNILSPPGLVNTLQSSWEALKRPADEAFYGGDLYKRARLDSSAVLPMYPQRPGEKDCSFYMRTRTCSFGSACKFDHPTWVPPGGIPDWKEVSVPAKKTALPVRPGEPDCAFYMKTGICKFGATCKFNHPQDQNTDGNVERDVDSAKTAVNGVEQADVSIKPAESFNAKGLPVRPGEIDCVFYMKTGSCKYGSTCRFNHPEKTPATIAALSQANIAAMLGLTGGLGTSSVLTGALPDYGLNLSVSDFGLQGLAATLYPQRPGEASCAFYMKTGICKFGSSCKFHHPINRTEPSSTVPVVKLTAAGLPRREGEQSCPYYMKTGTCKYGTTCRFDHPPPGEAAAKALAEAGKSDASPGVDS